MLLIDDNPTFYHSAPPLCAGRLQVHDTCRKESSSLSLHCQGWCRHKETSLPRCSHETRMRVCRQTCVYMTWQTSRHSDNDALQTSCSAWLAHCGTCTAFQRSGASFRSVADFCASAHTFTWKSRMSCPLCHHICHALLPVKVSKCFLVLPLWYIAFVLLLGCVRQLEFFPSFGK